MPFSDEKSAMEKKMQPLLAKSLRNMIRHKFITEYDYSDAIPLAEFITDDLMELIQSVVFEASTLKPGQLVWMAVEKEHQHKGYGTHLYDLPMKPVVLTFLTEDDIKKHIQTRGREQRLALMRDRMARMLKESQQQVGPLAQSRNEVERLHPRLSCLFLLFAINDLLASFNMAAGKRRNPALPWHRT